MPNEIGKIYDDAVRNARRLLISHCCLGLIAAFAFWARPGTVMIPLRPSVPHFANVEPILSTLIAWMPYVMSAVVSRALLEGRSSIATFTFIALAIVITAVSAAGYLNFFEWFSAAIIAGSVAFALVATAYVCSVFWPRLAAE